MKTNRPSSNQRPWAFSLIELLVVMAVIAVLAALIFPAAGHIKQRGIINRVTTGMKRVEAALANYQAEHGHYPPDNSSTDNPNAPAINPLFYELVGTKLADGGGGQEYQTDGGQSRITAANLGTFFGNRVSGFVNVSKGGGDEAQNAKNHLVGLKPAEYLEIDRSGVSGTVLGVSDKGPLMLTDASGSRSINPWRYTAGSATNNPGKYDLWIDVLIGGKTNRFCNWSERRLLVNDY
jgi:prepilin-type N-terminal cleavage/methylation domain-containing protein